MIVSTQAPRLNLDVNLFTQLLIYRGGRLALVRDGGRLKASLSGFEELCREVEALSDFADHEAIFLQVAPSSGKLMAAFVHKTCRGPAAGGTRAWSYPNLESFFRDGLRLSRGMTQKNALAQLWWGGGKGLVHDIGRLSLFHRGRLFRQYGRFVSNLQGYYFTAKDVGIHPEDIAEMYRTTRFITCIPPEYGGSGDPSRMTSIGVFRGIEAVREHLDSPPWESLTFVLQGLGEVGFHLLRQLVETGAKVKAFDIKDERCLKVSREFPGVEVSCSGAETVLEEACDILVPCALGGILNEKSIPRLRTKAICGAANNQLADPERDGQALVRRNILYAPDFLVNRMGIVGCADEPTGWLSDDPAILRHLGKEWSGGVYALTGEVLAKAKKADVSPHFIAVQIADELAEDTNPMFGHRGPLQAQQVFQRWKNVR